MRPIDFLSDNLITFPQYVNQNIDKMATDKSGNINYKMNEHGFRSTSITESSNFNILTLGCSWTIGLGVEQEKYQHLFKINLKIQHFGIIVCMEHQLKYKQYYKVLSSINLIWF